MSRVLVDTWVRVDHFRRRNAALVNLIQLDQALTHPMVVAELACGTPPAPRAQTLGDIALLHPAVQASLAEVQDFVDRENCSTSGAAWSTWLSWRRP